MGEVDESETHASCGSNADTAVGAVLDPDSGQGIGYKGQQPCKQAMQHLSILLASVALLQCHKAEDCLLENFSAGRLLHL